MARRSILVAAVCSVAAAAQSVAEFSPSAAKLLPASLSTSQHTGSSSRAAHGAEHPQQHAIAASNATPHRRMQSCADVACPSGQVLIEAASPHDGVGDDAMACCTCPPGTVTTYADEALAFRFRADGITREHNGSLVWNAATPSGLAFTNACEEAMAPERHELMSNEDLASAQCTMRDEPTIAYAPDGSLSGLSFSYILDGPTQNMYTNQSVAIGAKNTFFAAVTLAAGEILMVETLLGFWEVQFAWYVGFLNAPEGVHGLVYADCWHSTGFNGPAVQPETPQLIVAVSSYGTTTAGFDGPIVEMAVVDLSSPLDTIQWASGLYGDGIRNYGLETDSDFDFDFRDPASLDEGGDGNHAFGAGHMIIGSIVPTYNHVFQLRGTLHHLELHSETLTHAQVVVVLRRLRHTLSPNDAPAVLSCDDCKAGTRDHDSDPSTDCELCGQGTFSAQSAVTECTGTCAVGSTVLSKGALSERECSNCVVGRYGDVVRSVATCQPCEPGRYSTQVGATSSTACVGCTPGTFSVLESTSASACLPSGCMDEWADNWDPGAEVDEGRCVYTCSQLRERVGTHANVLGGCLLYSVSQGWQRFAHDGTILAGGAFATDVEGVEDELWPSDEMWIVQGYFAGGSTREHPKNAPSYPGNIDAIGGASNFTVRHTNFVPPPHMNPIHMRYATGVVLSHLSITDCSDCSATLCFEYSTTGARVSDSVIARLHHAGSKSPALKVEVDSEVTFVRVRWEDNTTPLGQQGNLLITLDSSATFEWNVFTGNRAQIGGAVFVNEACVAIFSNCLFRDNVAALRGGAIATGVGVELSIELTEFEHNEAAPLATRSVGAALFVETPFSVMIVHTHFSPFLDGAATVFISGRLGGCVQHPCDPGFLCSYSNYSITCTECEYPLVSTDGLSCVSCPAGDGPNANLSGCTKCPGVLYSTFGVCLEPTLGFVGSPDHTAEIDFDECSVDDGGCDPLAIKIGSCNYTADGAEIDCQSPCKNEVGTFRCGPCPDGFLRSDDGTCVLPHVTNTAAAATGTVRPETQLDVMLPEEFDDATQRQQQLIDRVVIQLAVTLQLNVTHVVVLPDSGRRLQSTASSIVVTVSIISDDAPAQMAQLAAQLQDPTSDLVRSGLFPVQQLDIIYMCPPGMTRREEEAVCRKCLWPQFTANRLTCADCPARQSPTPLGDSCQCADGYYSVAMDQLTCLEDEYDENVVATASDIAALPGSEVCQVCPTNPKGDSCAVCVAGQPPRIMPGYRERNELLSSSGQLVRFAFRCGGSSISDNVTAERCPAAEMQDDDALVPHACGVGYVGDLCLSCIADYHHVADRCEVCSSRAADSSFWVALAVIGGFPLFACCYACRNAWKERKRVKSGQIAHHELSEGGGIAAYFCPAYINQVRVAMRSAFQPLRIVISYMQVTSQVGPVLRIKYPDAFEEIVQVLKSVNFWDYLFDAECEGLDGFNSTWIVRVAVLPGILLVCMCAYFMIERSMTRKDAEVAATHLQSNLFMAVFFVCLLRLISLYQS